MDKNLAFLTSDVARLFRKRFEFATRGCGITGPQWRALLLIQHNPGINQGNLAALLEVEAITAGRMIDRLEKLGLVERRADPSDRRAWRLHLTDEAPVVLDALRERAGVVMDQFTEIFSEPEKDLFISFLSRMREKLLEPTENAESTHG